MTAEALRRKCLSMPGAVEEYPFGEGVSVFKVGGKIFAISAPGAELLQVSVKCEPELAEQLRLSYPAIRPGYHLNKRHWNTVTVDGTLADGIILEMVEDSYDLVVDGLPAAARDELR